MKLKGAEILMHCLQREGVDVVFGYPGGTVLPIYDALYDSPIKHILVRHEQGAAHAADGYARASGKVGVCIATSGPGAANLVTGIATANMDSVPMVCLTGQVASTLIGKDAFQEADINGIVLPITKHSYQVQKTEDVERTIKEAFYVARTNRPGPVLVDLPKDIMAREIDFEPDESPVKLRGYRVMKGVNTGQIIAAAEAINKAQRPVIYAGGGVITSDAAEEIREMAEKCRIPVTTTLMGMGAFPGTSYLSLGMLGMHGTRYANYAIGECDVLIAVGVRFDDRVTGRLETFAPNARVIHIDIDAAEIGKNTAAHIPIVGQAKEALQALLPRLKTRMELTEWHDVIAHWKDEFPLRYGQPSPGRIMPQHIVETIYDLTRGDAIITTEVGQNQMWAAQYYLFKEPRSFVSSGGLGTMGYGLPAAIGAKLACPEKTVFDIAGDGSIQMNIQELGTAMQYKIPVIICILNNQYLGMVRQWQELFHEGRYSYTDMSHQPDFVKLAEAYGAVGMRVNRTEDVRGALKEAMQITDRPVIIDFWVEREAGVYPMVPPGESILNMLGGDLDE
ncbi:MAG TPA: biosynthetic-type acetolactate synthase large subunit [Syntrophomonadaceae bacterium]|nr:biosynthetic-type acetolactate synthase large subunit [Syntrophomonadaceae bacterium]